MYMAEKKRIEWCRYYKGDDSFNEEELKKNWLYDYFWSGERMYVNGSSTYEEEGLVDTYREAGLANFDPRLPIELLAVLFSCVIHLNSGASLEKCANIFISEFYPSYINKSA